MEVLADASLCFLCIFRKWSQTGEDGATGDDDIVPVGELTETSFTKDIEGGFEVIEISSHRWLAVCATVLFRKREDVVRIEILLVLDLACLSEANRRVRSEDVDQADERGVQLRVFPIGGEETTQLRLCFDRRSQCIVQRYALGDLGDERVGKGRHGRRDGRRQTGGN